MGRTRSIAALAIVLTGLFIVCALVPRIIPSHRALFSLFFLYLVMTPGYLLAARFLPWTGGFLRALSSFVMGTALCFVFLFIIAIFRWDIRLLGFFVPPVVVVLSLMPHPPARAGNAGAEAPGMPLPAAGMARLAVMIALIAGVSILILQTGDPLFYTNDSADHIAYIRTVSRTHEVFPEQWYYRDGGMLTHDIRRGLLHALWGTLNSFTGGNDVITVWPIVSLIGSVAFIIALFCAGGALFGSPTIGIIAAVLFVLFYRGGLGEIELVRMAYAFLFGKIFYVTALAFLPRFVRRPETGYLVLIAASVFAATGTHINFFPITIFLLFVAALAALIHARGAERVRILFRRIPLLALVILATSGPYVALRYLRDYAPNNPIYMHVQGILYFTDGLYALNPTVFLGEIGTLGMLAMLSIPLLWRRARGDEALRLLLYGLLAYYILVFNPLWFPLMHEKLLYLLARFEALVPSMIVSAYLLLEFWRWARRRESALSSTRAILALLAAAACLAYPLAKLPGAFIYSKAKIERLRPYSYRNLDDLYGFINAKCPPGNVFLSDVFTSFSIPAFTDQYVVCSLDQHSVPNDSTAEERIADCRDFFTPSTSARAMKGILDKYGAEYVAVNGRIPPDIVALYWKPDLVAARALTKRLKNAAPAFEMLYERDDLAVFRFAGGSAAAAAGSPVDEGIPFAGDSVTEMDLARSAASGQPGIRIKGVSVSRERVRRGDTLQVRVAWVAEEKPQLRRYMAFLRFDTDYSKNALFRESYDKLYRKALETVKRERYRFRIDFLPMGGIFAPDIWPPLREVRDTVIIAVPPDVAPGTYAISLRLEVTPQFPNYHLRDFFSDRDYYSGVEVARIAIE
jgi:hypothetical protein